MSTELKVMLSNLPPSDSARLQAFLRVGSERLRNTWSVGSDGNARLLIYGGEAPETIPGLFDVSPRLVRVCDADQLQDGADVLVRPIEFEALIGLLLTAEGSLNGNGSPAPSAPSLPPHPPAATAAVDSLAASQTVPQPAPATQVRLKRWPPSSLLGDWRYGMRMASFMSARFLSVAELSKLSNVSEDECRRFVDALMAGGLLRVRDDAAVAAGPLNPADTSPPRERAQVNQGTHAATLPTSARFGSQLLGLLRRKLGISIRGD